MNVSISYSKKFDLFFFVTKYENGFKNFNDFFSAQKNQKQIENIFIRRWILLWITHNNEKKKQIETAKIILFIRFNTSTHLHLFTAKSAQHFKSIVRRKGPKANAQWK